jgi:signal transduction histidine kinase
MFPAELTAVFSNLLTNAVKAAGERGSICATGSDRPVGGATLVIENTGVAVDLADSERWFRPFESTTVNMDSSLGHGMGLGLTITRDVLEQYGATIRFVKPSPGYATAVEVRFPSEKEGS